MIDPTCRLAGLTADDDVDLCEPTDAELWAIELESASIEAGIAVVGAECRLARNPCGCAVAELVEALIRFVEIDRLDTDELADLEDQAVTVDREESHTRFFESTLYQARVQSRAAANLADGAQLDVLGEAS